MLITVFASFGQNEVDALRFSQFLPSGTARYTAMGGAFGALGSDLTSMATNPAGIGIYRKSEIGMSTVWTNHNSTSVFNGTKTENSRFSFQLGNLGFVVNNPVSNSADWKWVNYGFAYNHLNDYNRAFSIKGYNSSSSMLDYEVDKLNSKIGSENDNPYYLAEAIYYNADEGRYMNDYQEELDGSLYGSDQQYEVISKGYAGEYDFNVSANYKNILYIGGTMGFQRIDYEQTTFYSELPSAELVLHNYSSEDYLKARGSGFNLKLGMMLKLNHMIRIGAAIHTPTLYNFSYDYWTDVNATIEIDNEVFNNMKKSPRGNYNWEFSSPARYMFSSAIVLGNLGVISAEIDYVDYTSMNISASDYLFEEENSAINKIYRGVTNYKLGAELRLGAISVRGGAGYLGSPFASGEANSDAARLMASGGVGMNAGLFYFDAAYQYITGSEEFYMYGYESSRATIDNVSSKFMVTLGFRF